MKQWQLPRHVALPVAPVKENANADLLVDVRNAQEHQRNKSAPHASVVLLAIPAKVEPANAKRNNVVTNANANVAERKNDLI